MTPRKTTPQQEAEICARYETGEPDTIHAEYGISRTTLHAILARGGATKRRKVTDSPYTADLERTVCERYDAGENTPGIAASVGINRSTVGRILIRNGLKTRDPADTARKYACDLGFFDEITTEARAYWLGFLAADGYNSGKALKVAIAEEDAAHLESLKAALGSTHPVRFYPYTTAKGLQRLAATLYIGSPELSRALTAHGVTPRKSRTLRWPSLAPDLMRHFLRGYVDGDGGFHGRKNVPSEVTFHVTSNMDFLADARAYLINRCDLGFTVLNPRSAAPGFGQLRYSGRKQVRRIVDLLYTDATVFLPRKHVTVLALL